jgi:hypothetical protein
MTLPTRAALAARNAIVPLDAARVRCDVPGMFSWPRPLSRNRE